MLQTHFDFEWNAAKASANLKKHGVSFEEGATAFEDEFARVLDDEEHSEEEPRQILIGYSERNRLLFVSFMYRAENLVRIISARKADSQECQDYEENARF
jgi:uncharacterized DUF497 family protein